MIVLNCPNCGGEIEVLPGDTAVDCPFCGTNLRISAEGELRPFFDAPTPDEGPDEDLAQVEKLVREGRKIEAIKMMRERTNLGLKDAKDLVDEMARSSLDPARPRPAPPPIPGLDWSQVRTLLEQGKKIEAIKAYREATGATLKESKEAVDAFQAGLPVPQAPAKKAGPGPCQALRWRSRGCGSGCLGLLLIVFLALAGCGLSVKNNELYTCAVTVLAADPVVQRELGSPIWASIPLVLGYSSQSDFGGNSQLEFQTYAFVRGPEKRSLFFIAAFTQSSGRYGVRANPLPNPQDIQIEIYGSQLAGCLE